MNARNSLVLWLAGALSLIAPLAASSAEPAGSRPLDRMACQRAIEEVYWSHRTWPESNPGPKPALDEILPASALSARIDDTLKKSRALEAFWSAPITGPMLQAEMDRMARSSRRPEVLGELWAALGNDPYLIAETLARPQLAERLLRSRFASDERIHGPVRDRARSDLAACASPQGLLSLQGACEIEYVNAAASGGPGGSPRQGTLYLNAAEWDMTVRRLLSVYGAKGPADGPGWSAIPLGRLSGLLEDEAGLSCVAVLSASPASLRLVRAEWPKRTLDDWWQEVSASLEADLAPPDFPYELPTVVAGSCTDDAWGSMSSMPVLSGRIGHTAVWADTVMIVWGGFDGTRYLSDGAVYDPASDSWTVVSPTGAPTARTGHTAVWTGTQMIVWGGYDGSSYLSTGYLYDPLADSWTAMTASGPPAGRNLHTATWTGSAMIVWGGGQGAGGLLNTGGVYDPTAGTWTATSTVSAPTARTGHTAVWANGYSKMIVWGGSDASGRVNTGGIYLPPPTNTWAATNTGTNLPSARDGHSAAWVVDMMVIWGGQDASNTYLNTGAKYDPSKASPWTTLAIKNAPSARRDHTAVTTSDAYGTKMLVWGGTAATYPQAGGVLLGNDTWSTTGIGTTGAPSGRKGHTAVSTGTGMLVWGGQNDSGMLSSGGTFVASSSTWTSMSSTNGAERVGHTAVSTGSEVIVWGGFLGPYGFTQTSSGGRYDPATDVWTPTPLTGAPSARDAHTAVWSGTEMIVWGGETTDLTNTGGRLNPTSGSWTATATTGAPSARLGHTAVWAGTQMLVWGGTDLSTYLNTGGRYVPGSNSWSDTSYSGACPTGRSRHTALWTNTEMLVWGGFDGTSDLATGGRYNPTANSWAAMQATGAPEAREAHTAVWTGTEMIVWGGQSSGSLNSGGRYSPAYDSWIPTNLTGAPAGRSGHTAVWTGKEMIVWGGQSTSYQNTGGRYSGAWRSTATTGAPEARTSHTASWIGSQMAVCDGLGASGSALNSGGLYCASPSGSGPRPVPDGLWVLGQPARASKSDALGSTIQVQFDASTCPNTRYNILYGNGSAVSTLTQSGAACTIGTSGTYSWNPAPAVPGGESFIWWVLVGSDGVQTESSWGRDSAGSEEHPAASGACSCTLKSTATTCP